MAQIKVNQYSIPDDAIDSQHYAAGSLDTAHIADDQITLAKMAGGTDGNILTYDARARDISYPNLKEFAEAYTEKEIGGDSTKCDAYVVKYNKVRSDNQKP
jgi:signal transduction histidine kinase